MRFFDKIKFVFELIFWTMVIVVTAYGLFTQNVFHLLSGTLGITVGMLCRIEETIDKITSMVSYNYNMKRLETTGELLKMTNEIMEQILQEEKKDKKCDKKCKCGRKAKAKAKVKEDKDEKQTQETQE